MEIRYYGYNAFTITHGTRKVAIDPGGDLRFLSLRSVIPRSEWAGTTHILVTHGDPDHHWHTDRLAAHAGAWVVCSETMVTNRQGRELMLGPRDRGLAFTTHVDKLRVLGVGQTIEVEGLSVTGVKTSHGPLTLRLGCFTRTLSPGPGERIGWGAIGFLVRFDGQRVVNLGDTLLEREAWKAMEPPEVLMAPIGGTTVANTMSEGEALEAARMIRPRIVIPCHYNCHGFFSRCANPANAERFRAQVEAIGSRCVVLEPGGRLVL